MAYLLDSVILIDHFNGIEQATSFLGKHGGSSALSVVTRAEVLTGFADGPWQQARRLLDRFETIPINETVADLAATLRREHRWKLPDAFQAAIAQHFDRQLVTRNTKDFDPARQSFVVVPYTL